MEWDDFVRILREFTKKEIISADDLLFRGGVDISSIGFTEFIMTLEEEYDREIELDDLDESIKTVRQLFDRLNAA